MTARTVFKTLTPQSNFVEYGLVRPDWRRLFRSLFIVKFDSQVATNPWGHSFIRYGNHISDTVMNIGLNQTTNTSITFYDPYEYLFTSTGQQGGVEKRTHLTIRIENISDEKLKQITDHYKTMEALFKQDKIRFHLLGHIMNLIKGGNMYGNCAYWTSTGLQHINIIEKTTNFPALLFLKIFVRQLIINDPKNINITLFKSVYYKSEPSFLLINPVIWIKQIIYNIWGLNKMANIIVEPIPNGDEYDLNVTYNDQARDHWLKLSSKLIKLSQFKDDVANQKFDDIIQRIKSKF